MPTARRTNARRSPRWSTNSRNLASESDITNEDYLTALGQQRKLKADIAVLEAKVGSQAGRLAELEALLTKIAYQPLHVQRIGHCQPPAGQRYVLRGGPAA